MSTAFLVEYSELKLAYKRAKDDRTNRCFVEYPYLIDWAEIDLTQWFKDLQERLAGGYQPHSSKLCWIPKANSLLRPGNIIHLKDEVVYNLIVSRLYKRIWTTLREYQGDPDAAYILAEPEEQNWIKNNFKSWEKFREVSLAYLEKGAQFVVVSDITGFYENIYIDKLLSDLRQICEGSLPEIELLRVCLRKWSARGDKSIPQGYSASDILSKVYAHPIDIALRNDGYRHLRYVDDMRVFCRSRLEAKQAILCLSQHIHKRGLNIQSAKTRILSRTEAFSLFDGVKPIVQGIQKELFDEIRKEIAEEGPYADPKNISLLLQSRKELPAEVLERTFSEYFAASNPAPFDKTLFHFLLNRLAKAKSSIAANYCLDALRERVEETAFLLDYFSNLDLEESEMESVIEYVVSPSAIYDYQCYQIVRWLFREEVFSEKIVKYCRSVARDMNRDLWLRSYASAYLGKHGNISDLQLIQSMYANCSGDLERADCVMALKRLEAGKRNAFYGEVFNDGPLVARAVSLAKGIKRKKQNAQQ